MSKRSSNLSKNSFSLAFQEAFSDEFFFKSAQRLKSFCTWFMQSGLCRTGILALAQNMKSFFTNSPAAVRTSLLNAM